MQLNFLELVSTLGKPENIRKVSKETIETYRGKLPDGLLDFWSQIGWCSFLDGYMWLCDPAELHPILEEAFYGDKEFSAANLVPYMCGAFGEISAWSDFTKVAKLRIATPDPSFSIQTKEALFDRKTGIYWSDEQAVFRTMEMQAKARTDLAQMGVEDFFSAVETFGPLGQGEIYGYVPATALGGPGTVETIKKVALVEHLLLILQARDVSLEKHVFDMKDAETYPFGRMEYVRKLGDR